MTIAFLTHEITVAFFALFLCLTVLATLLVRLIVVRRRRAVRVGNLLIPPARASRWRYLLAASAIYAAGVTLFCFAAYHPLIADRHLTRAMRAMKDDPGGRSAFRHEIAQAAYHLREARSAVIHEPFLYLLERRWGAILDAVSRSSATTDGAPEACPKGIGQLRDEIDAFIVPRDAEDRLRIARTHAEHTYLLARCLAERGEIDGSARYLTQALLIEPRLKERALSSEPMRRVMRAVDHSASY